MALRQIRCPHCERDVEVEVTHVTLSRKCPNCGNSIDVQHAIQQQRDTQTSGTVPSATTVEKPAEASYGVHGSPRVLEGDVLERMKHDPEVRKNMRRVVWGTCILIGVIVLLTIADHFAWWSAFGRGMTPSVSRASTRDALIAESEEKPAPMPPAASTLSSRIPGTAPADSSSAPVIGTPAPPLSEDDRAMQAVASFLNANNVEERLLLVRDLKTMEPVIRAYYSGHPDGPIAFKSISTVPVASRVALVREFEVELSDGQKRRATAGRAASGDYKVDWASFVVYSAMDWDEFVKKRPTDPVFMRVLMEPASKYDGDFADEKTYVCVKLTDPLNPASPPLHGYAHRRSAVGQSLNLMLRTHAGAPVPMMFTLKHPPQAEGTAVTQGQVLLDKLIGEGWLASGT